MKFFDSHPLERPVKEVKRTGSIEQRLQKEIRKAVFLETLEMIGTSSQTGKEGMAAAMATRGTAITRTGELMADKIVRNFLKGAPTTAPIKATTIDISRPENNQQCNSEISSTNYARPHEQKGRSQHLPEVVSLPVLKKDQFRSPAFCQ